jgi:flagellar hook-length control protein FliK
MLFNPIFINPQKFLSTPETSGVKKNKLTYLFSDIIKNSLGAKKNDNETSSLDLQKVNKENLTPVKLIDTTISLNSISKTEEEIVLELTNILSTLPNIKDISDSNPKLILSGENGTTEILNDEQVVSTAIAGILELIEKYDLNVEEGQVSLSEEAVSRINTDKLLSDSPEVKKILNAISSGKQLNINIQVGKKNIGLEISKPQGTIENNDLVSGEAAKPITAKSENEKTITQVSEKLTNEVLKQNNVKAPSVVLEKQPVGADTKAHDIKLSNPSVPTNNIKTIAETIVKDDQVKVEPGLFKITVTNKSVSMPNENSVLTGNTNEVTKSENKPTNEFVKQIKIQLDHKIVQSDKTIDSEIPKVKVASSAEISNQKIIRSAEKPIEESANKLVQSIKKLDNKMLKPDFVPKAIKFSPTAIEEIKNQKFELLNLSTAVRTIKSMGKPVGEFVSSADDKTIAKTFTINKLEPTPKKIELQDDAIKIKPADTKNILNVKSDEILTSMKSKISGVEVKELRKFLADNKNSDLILRIVKEEKLVKSDAPKSELTKNITKEQVAEPKLVVGDKTVKQPHNSVEKFEIDFEKFKGAIKERSVAKEIQNFVDSPKDLTKAKLVIETSKPAVIEQTEIKQNAVPKNFGKEVVKEASVKQSAPVDEKIIKPEIKNSETNTNEQQKEVKAESSSTKEQNTNSSENRNSENRQPANNNYAKAAEANTVKISSAPVEENFSDSFKSAASVNNVEATTTNSSNDILSLPKELTGNVREIKAADIYKELFKLAEKKEKQSITLQLIPKKLGRVKVVVDIIDQMLQTKIEVENESAKQLLQNNMDALKQSLNQSGIQLSSYTISLSNPNGKNFKPFAAKKKVSGNEDLENNENENTPVSGKKLGYNTYEYLA